MLSHRFYSFIAFLADNEAKMVIRLDRFVLFLQIVVKPVQFILTRGPDGLPQGEFSICAAFTQPNIAS